MTEGIIIGILSLCGTLVGAYAANRTSQAVINTRLEELTREVRAHNGFAQRIPVLEEQMKVANHRIQDLENQNNH